jgi:hypothetical protein
MRWIGIAVVAVVFFIANCYAIKWSCAAMNYDNDLVFFVGFTGLFLLGGVNFLIAVRILRYVSEQVKKVNK